MSAPRFPVRPTESLRVEAARRKISLYTVRAERAEAQGVSRRVGAGHAKAGETPLAGRGRRVVEVGGKGSPIAPITLRNGGFDSGRAYRLIRDFHDLLSGQLSVATWDSRWSGHVFGGQKLPSAAMVLAAGQAGRIDADQVGSA